ncbi:hypothetical protein EON77_20530, partial [bacterium]
MRALGLFLLAPLLAGVTLWSFLVKDAAGFQNPAFARVFFWHFPCPILATILLAMGTYFSYRALNAPAQDGREVESAPLIVAPEKAWQGSGFDQIWLLTVQLYSIRSPRNWGIGDFSDLMTLIDLAAARGCDGIGLNPLHVLFDDRPDECSPYAPNSRLFLNPLYVDAVSVPELPNDWIDRHRNDIATARSGEIIDYEKVAALK